jgi:hypothetical protein
MSDIPADLNLREQLVRIDNFREEALKFAAEQHKLAEEAARFPRARWLVPALLVNSSLGAIGGLFSVLHVAGVF